MAKSVEEVFVRRFIKRALSKGRIPIRLPVGEDLLLKTFMKGKLKKKRMKRPRKTRTGLRVYERMIYPGSITVSISVRYSGAWVYEKLSKDGNVYAIGPVPKRNRRRKKKSDREENLKAEFKKIGDEHDPDEEQRRVLEGTAAEIEEHDRVLARSRVLGDSRVLF